MVGSLAVGVGSVGIEQHGGVVREAGEGAEVQLKVAGGPVGDAADVPGIAFAAGHDDVLPHLALQGDGLVPDGGQGGEEARVPWLMGSLQQGE